MNIYLVEDDKRLGLQIEKQLNRYGYQVYFPRDFSDIIQTFVETEPNLVLMDVNLPVFDGFYWCQKIREQSLVPIIFISARDSNMDQVMALEYGADDYLVKPFSLDLMHAKVKSHIRRIYGDYAMMDQGRILKTKELQFFPEKLQVVYQEKEEQLTIREGELLGILMKEYPKIVHREIILAKLWDDERFVDDNTLSVNVGRLRRKLMDLGLEEPIQTVRGKGYGLHIKDQRL